MGKTKKSRLQRSCGVKDLDQKQNTKRPYTFHIGAGWSKKSRPFANQNRPSHPSDKWKEHTLTTYTRSVASEKEDPGEDFFFIQEMPNQSGVSIGVADGVGGYSEIGVDPSLFSQALMYYAHESMGGTCADKPEINPTTDNEQAKGTEMAPYECLDLAHSRVLQDDLVRAGASTACILSLDASSGLLRSANLGDSGYLIIRSNDVLYTSTEQTHQFNCPKQLAKVPKRSIFMEYINDKPSEAETHEVQLRDGDIVVLYTDGFSDNVFPSEVVSTISSSAAQAGETEDERVQNMADQLVDYATECMYNEDKVTPFQSGAERVGWCWADCAGGKPDDVTVIVGLVRKTS